MTPSTTHPTTHFRNRLVRIIPLLTVLPFLIATGLPMEDEVEDRERIRDAIEEVKEIRVRMGAVTPHDIARGILAFGKDFKVYENKGDTFVPAVKYLLREATYKGKRIVLEKDGEVRIIVTGRDRGEVQDLPDEILMILAIAGVPLDEKIVISEKKEAKVEDLLRTSMKRIDPSAELSCSLVAFARYLPPGEEWKVKRARGKASVTRLLQASLQKNPSAYLDEGAYHLYALGTLAKKAGKGGGWPRALREEVQNRLAQRRNRTKSQQGPSGRLGFMGVGSFEETSRHLNWIVNSGPWEKIHEPWIDRAALRLAKDLRKETQRPNARYGTLALAARVLSDYYRLRYPGAGDLEGRADGGPRESLDEMKTAILPILIVTIGLGPAPSEELDLTIERFNSSKNLRIEHRLPTILAFAKVREPASVRYLEKIYQEEILREAKEAALTAMAQMEILEAAAFLLDLGGRREHGDLISEGLGKSTDPEVRDLIYARAKGKGAASVDERVLAIEVVALFGDERALEALLDWVKDRRSEIRAAVARGLRSFDEEATLDALAYLLEDRAREVQIQAIEALAKRKKEVPDRVWKTALSSKVWEVRAHGLTALHGRKEDWVFKRAKERLLEDKDWHVLVEAVMVLTSIREKRSVEILIEAMGKSKEGRVLKDIRRALEDLTGMRFQAIHEDWVAWWEQFEDTFEVRPEDGEISGGGPTRRRKDDQATNYYGMEVRSRKVTFVIDASESMGEEYIPPGTKGTQEEGKEDKVRKIDVAKKELAELIERLKPNVYFNVYYFNAFPQPWRPSLVKNTPTNRKAALEFVERGKPLGVTNIYDTLERVMGDKNVDTIYLLTDGVPTAGKYKRGHLNEFKMAVAELNLHRKVSINTISFGDQTQSYKWFLEALAEENFGQYVER